MTSYLSSPARLAGFLLLLANLGCHTTPTSLSNRLNISDDGARVEYAGRRKNGVGNIAGTDRCRCAYNQLGEFVTGIAKRSATGGNQYCVFCQRPSRPYRCREHVAKPETGLPGY